MIGQFIVDNFLSLSWLGDTAESIFFGICASIYSLVARAYYFMISLATNYGALVDLDFIEFADNIYILAGVFMLFRVVVSLFQMLIDPDQVNDKQVGAGKLISRIVVVVVLLILCYPSGILFRIDNNKPPKDGGLLQRVEYALLTDDSGIIQSIFNGKAVKGSSSITKFNSNTSDNKWECYYGNVRGATLASGITKDEKYFGVKFASLTKKGKCPSGYKHRLKTKKGEKLDICYSFMSGKVYNTSYTFSIPMGKDGQGQLRISYKMKEGKCPSYIAQNAVYSNSAIQNPREFTNKASSVYATPYAGNTEQALAEETGGAGEKHLLRFLCTNGFDSKTGSCKERDAAIDFARNVALVFIDCYSGDSSKCTTTDNDSKLFDTKEGNDKAVEEYKGDGLSIEIIPLFICGIALVVYLIILCVDVIVRRFKLLLLELIAPLAIICYANPKDKIFMQWAKMYGATYLDLFIKLIAIGLTVTLLDFAMKISEGSGLAKLLYLFALLIFAKMIPSMISKIFGIDAAGGTFKDIMGMGKKTLGFGAGAAVGAAAGLVTGASAFRATKGQNTKDRFLALSQGLGSGISGALRGAGSGSKGKILGGAQSIAEVNSKKRSLYAGGASAGEVISNSVLSKLGMDHASVTDRKLDAQQQKAKSLTSNGETFDKMKSNAKDTKLYQNLANYKDENGNSILSANDQSKLADIITQGSLFDKETGEAYINRELINSGIVSKFEDNGIERARFEQITGSEIYSAKEANKIQNAYAEYNSAIAENGDIQSVFNDTGYLRNTLNIAENDMRLLDSNDIEHAVERTKLQNRIVNESSGYIQRDINIEKSKKEYKSAQAIKDAYNPKK